MESLLLPLQDISLSFNKENIAVTTTTTPYSTLKMLDVPEKLSTKNLSKIDESIDNMIRLKMMSPF
jgi:hypothetical protein